MNYDVIIIGAGPGGIFSAYELSKLRPDIKIAVFEAGHALSKRKCPIDGKKINYSTIIAVPKKFPAPRKNLFYFRKRESNLEQVAVNFNSELTLLEFAEILCN